MSLKALVGTLAVYLALNFLVIFVLFPAGLLRVLSGPTGGLVSSTLLANVLMLVVLVGFLRWATGLKAEDIGMQRAGLGTGLVLMPSCPPNSRCCLSWVCCWPCSIGVPAISTS